MSPEEEVIIETVVEDSRGVCKGGANVVFGSVGVCLVVDCFWGLHGGGIRLSLCMGLLGICLCLSV